MVLGGIPEDIEPEADNVPAGDELPVSPPPLANAGDPGEFDVPTDNQEDGAEAAHDAEDNAEDDAAVDAPSGTPSVPQTPEEPLCSNAPSWWVDTDADGYGAGTPLRACSRPTAQHVPRSGDCADDNPDVHPGQAEFFSEPYLRADNHESYDYNCSGSEEGDGSLQLATNCTAIITAKCGGAGYAKLTQSRPAGNSYCGSTSIETCKASLAVVLCKAEASTTDLPYRCR